MRLDPVHAEKIAKAIVGGRDGAAIKFDIQFMVTAFERLSMWERGVLHKALLRAARSKRRSPEQSALLALFVHQEGGNG